MILILMKVSCISNLMVLPTAKWILLLFQTVYTSLELWSDGEGLLKLVLVLRIRFIHSLREEKTNIGLVDWS